MPPPPSGYRTFEPSPTSATGNEKHIDSVLHLSKAITARCYCRCTPSPRSVRSPPGASIVRRYLLCVYVFVPEE